MKVGIELNVLNARNKLKEGKVIEAYDILGEVLKDIEEAKIGENKNENKRRML